MGQWNDNLKRVHQTLINSGYNPPAYEQFAKDMLDDQNLRRVHATLQREGYTPPEYLQFRSDMGWDDVDRPEPKPKAQAQPKPQPKPQAKPKPQAQPQQQAQAQPSENKWLQGTSFEMPDMSKPAWQRNLDARQRLQEHRTEEARAKAESRPSKSVFKNEQDAFDGVTDEERNHKTQEKEAEQKRMEAIGQQMQDRYEYKKATGKELTNENLNGGNYVPLSEYYAPALERDENGEVVFEENSREPKGYMSGDQDRLIANYGLRAWEEENDDHLEDLEKAIEQMDDDVIVSYAPSITGAPVVIQKAASHEKQLLLDARQEILDRRKALEKQARGVKGFLNGAIDTAQDWDTWTFGVTSLSKNKRLLDIAEKQKRGEALNEYEQALLKAKMMRDQAESELESSTDKNYRAGQMFTNMGSFMLTIMPTGGYGAVAGAMTKGVTRFAAGVVADTFAKRMGLGLLKGAGIAMGDVAAGFLSATTLGAANTANDIMQRKAGQLQQTEDGGYEFVNDESWLGAVAKGLASQTKEYATERFGEHLPSMREMNVWLAKRGVGGRKIAKALSGAAGVKAMRKTSEWLRKGGVNGLFGETLEEEIGMPVDVAIGDMTWDDVFSGKTQGDIAYGLALTMGAMHFTGAAAQLAGRGGAKAYNSVQYARYKRRADKVGNAAADIMSPEKWNPLRERIDTTPNENIGDLIKEIVNDKDNYSEEEKRAAYDYINAIGLMRGYALGAVADAQEKAEDGAKVDNTPPTPAEQVEIETSIKEGEGYNIEEAEEKPKARKKMESDRRHLEDLLNKRFAGGEFAIEDLDDDPETFMDRLTTLLGEESDEVLAAHQYIQSKAVYDGMIDRVRDDIDNAVQQNEKEIDGRTNTGDGLIHPATMKSDGKQVYIIDGSVESKEDGSVDAENSSNEVIVKGVDGKPDMIPAEDLGSVEEAINPQQLKDESSEAIRQEMATEAGRQIDGYPERSQHVLHTPEGDVNAMVVSEEDSEGKIGVMLDKPINGKTALLLTRQELDNLTSDNPVFNESEGANASEEVTEDTAEQPAEPEVQTTDDGAIPLMEDGEPDFMAVDPSTAQQHIYNGSGFSPEVADQFVEAKRNEAQGKRESLAKREPKFGDKEIGSSYNKYKTAHDAWQSEMDAATAEENYWNNVKAERERAMQAAEQDEARMRASEENAAEQEAEPAVQEEATQEEQYPWGEREEKRRKPLRERVEEWSKATGVKVNIVETLDGVTNKTVKTAILNGERVKGWFSPETGEVYIYMPYNNGAWDIDETFLHEVIAHKGMRELLGKKRFNKLCDLVFNSMSTQDKIKYLTYPGVSDKSGVEAQRAAADEYMAALSERSDYAKSTWKQIVAAFRDALRNLGFVLQATDDDIKDLLVQSYLNLNYQARKEAAADLVARGADVDEEKGDVRCAVADVLEGDDRKKVIKELMAVTGRSEKTVKKYLQAEESLARVILSGDNAAFLDLQVDESVPSIWKNSDYPQGTVEFSNICRKRLPFTLIYQRLQEEFPNRVFDASTLEDIRQIMKNSGADVACGLCFVEDRRQLLGEIGQGFVDALKGKNKKVNDEQKVALERLRESGDNYVPTLYDILTLDGMKKLRKSHPSVAQAFVEYNNARGMQAGRLFNAYSAYHREILDWNKKKVKSVNDAGGLRIFSFSDFEAHHLIDLVQVLTDCAAKGVKVQGYTKVPEFAKAVKDTNMKLNRSLIAKAKGIVDADYVPQEGEAVSPNVIDGKRLLFDTIEGIDVNHPDFFDSTGNKNVGNILVGINDEMIRIAMLDPFVDYIIPFHSGLSAEIRQKKGIGDWVNYKLLQLEKKRNDKGSLVNADKHGINIYTDVIPRANELIGHPIRNARDFQRAFFAACKEKGWTPRFYKFINTNAKGEYVYTPGYEKLLIDFKLFDKNGKYVPQEEIQPIFDNEFNAKILNDYVEGEKAKLPIDDLYNKVKAGLGLADEQGSDTRMRVADEQEIQGLEGYKPSEVKDIVRNEIEQRLSDAGVEGVTIKDIALHGSRLRGDAREDSDLDVVMEYDGDISEDGLFNIINEEPIEIDGVKVDVNPITEGKSGTMAEYMQRSREYDERKRAEEAVNEESAVRFSLVTDPKEIERLEAEPKVKVYRAMQMVDGNLYPPMAGKINGEWQTPIQLGTWEQSDEHPELADENGKFKLDKGNGSSPMPVAYNPYLHTSRSPLNDQFSSAWNRPELVTVEVEIPESELTSGYKAEKAKDAVGEIDWKSGSVSGKLAKMGNPRKVILSRYDKPVRVVPNEEVAQRIAEMLKDTDLEIPFNTVTPELRDALVAQGVKIGAPEKGNAGQKSKSAYEEWKKEGSVRFKVAEVNKKFNEQLQQQIEGTLPKNHVYNMGMPSNILLSTGFPNVPIELSASHLAEKANVAHHPFGLNEVKDLVKAIQHPMAVFTYGDKNKSQNVIVEIQHEGKNFVVGIHFNQERHGMIVSDIRGLYPKDNAEWLNWISQGKMLYADKKKIQTLINQQRRTLAEVKYLDLNSVTKIIQDFENPKYLGEKVSGQVKFRISPEEDAEYMKAVEDGDMDKAQQMVIAAAKKAMPDTKVVDENGEPRVVYHGSPISDITAFDLERAGRHTGAYGDAAIYATDSEDVAEVFSHEMLSGSTSFTRRLGEKGKTYPLYMDIKNPFDLRQVEESAEMQDVLKGMPEIGDGAFFDSIMRGIEAGNHQYAKTYLDFQRLQELGYDGVIARMYSYENGNDAIEYGAFAPNQIKSADPVTYDDNGNVIPLSERFNEENPDIRFRVGDTFYSNAEHAVEGIKQEKATPEQWLKMIEKAGGLKAGEDKWLGLSDWLKSQDKKSLTKQEVMDFIRENQIQVEEVNYADTDMPSGYAYNLRKELERKAEEVCEEIDDEYHDRLVEAKDSPEEMDDLIDEVTEEARRRLDDAFGVPTEDFIYFDLDNLEGTWLVYKPAGSDLSFSIDFAQQVWSRSKGIDAHPIDERRLPYTTGGLENKKEIALIVPTIEPWRENDMVHFGDAGDGRAVAWIRFGETSIGNKELADKLHSAEKELDDFEERMYDKYDNLASLTKDEEVERKRLAQNKRNAREEYFNSSNQRVLVIDEIQSNRHQKGREEGYRDNARAKEVDAELDDAIKEVEDATRNVLHRQGYKHYDEIDNEKFAHLKWDYDVFIKASGGLLGTQEEMAKIKELGEKAKELQDEDYEIRHSVPDAPFDKNWHELAMKRMLRYAAENGYDKLAWTKGDQQTERYNLGGVIDSISSSDWDEEIGADFELEGEFKDVFAFDTEGNEVLNCIVGKDGIVETSLQDAFDGKHLSEIVGKELASKLLKDGEQRSDGDGLRVGGEGMRGFYDQMLPRFMDKYGKKWGVKTQEVELPGVEKAGRTMWSVDITPEMKESVMQGQPMFRVADDRESYAQRQWRRAHALAEEWAGKLNLGDRISFYDSIDDVPNSKNFSRQQKRNKGWYDPETDKIVVVYNNHRSPQDVLQTILREGVARYGLRELFGENYDTFLDNVWDAADIDIKEAIAARQASLRAKDTDKRPWYHYRRIATEDYLARLAEDTDFERADRSTSPQHWFNRVKAAFLQMLRDLGVADYTGDTLTDNELRYILWRSYKNLSEPGLYRNPFRRAENIAMQIKLNVGNYAQPEFNRQDEIDIERKVADMSDKEAKKRLKELRKMTAAEDGTLLENMTGKAGAEHIDKYDKRIVSELMTLLDKVGEETPENTPMFRVATDAAADMYDRQMSEKWTRIREAWQDSMISVKTAMDEILKMRGEKAADNEDAYNFENLMHGMSRNESEYFEASLYNPILDAIDALAEKSGRSVDDIIDYLIAKHGLERNKVMAAKAFQKYQQDHPNGTKTQQDFIRDYSGLTDLTGLSDLGDATDDAEMMVADMENGNDNEINALWQAINAATSWTLEKSFRSGELTPEAFREIRSMYQYYIPLRGWDDTNAHDVYDYIAGSGNAYSPAVKKAKGRFSKADNPIAYIGTMGITAIVGGNKNLLKQHLYRFAVNHPSSLLTVSEQWYQNIGTEDNPQWVAVLPNIPANATADQIADAIDQFNTDMEQLEEQGMATKERGKLSIKYPQTASEKREHCIQVKIGGKDYVIYVNGNPRVAQAINGDLSRKANEASQESSVLASINRTMAMNFTSRNPAFILSNAARDLQMAASVVSIKEDPDYARRFYMNTIDIIRPRKVKGGGIMVQLMTKYLNGTLDNNNEMERMFGEFMRNGGETGFTTLKDVDAYKKRIEKEFGRRHPNGTLKTAQVKASEPFRVLADNFEFLNRCIEDMTRFITYRTSRQMGKTIAQSIADAKNVTLNFNRKGSGAMGNATIRNWWIFVNPAIQGLSLLGQLAWHHRKKFVAVTAGFTLGGALMPLVNAMTYSLCGGGDEDDYWNLPGWIRHNNIVIKVPFVSTFITIPLPQEFRAFYGLGETLTSVAAGHPSKHPALDVLDQTLDLLPVSFTGSGGSIPANFSPTLLQPLVQIWENTDFTGKPIHRDSKGYEYEPLFQRAYQSTPRWLVGSSRWINERMGGNDHKMSWYERSLVGRYGNDPAIVNHIMKGYFGGMYSFIAQSAGVLTTALGGNVPKYMEMPIVSRFVNDPMERTVSSRIGEEYWDRVDERNRYRNELNKYKKDAKAGVKGADEHVKEMEQSDDYKRYEAINRYINRIDKMRQDSKNSDSESKSIELDKIIADRVSDLNKVNRLTDEQIRNLPKIITKKGKQAELYDNIYFNAVKKYLNGLGMNEGDKE